MRSLTTRFLNGLTLTVEQASTLNRIGEYRGKQDLFSKQTPETLQSLGDCVDGFRLTGLENRPPGLSGPADPAGELHMAAYLGALIQWLLDHPVEIEIGWGVSEQAGHMDDYIEAGCFLAGQGLAGAVWLNLMDPGPGLYHSAPWILRRQRPRPLR